MSNPAGYAEPLVLSSALVDLSFCLRLKTEFNCWHVRWSIPKEWCNEKKRQPICSADGEPRIGQKQCWLRCLAGRSFCAKAEENSTELARSNFHMSSTGKAPTSGVSSRESGVRVWRWLCSARVSCSASTKSLRKHCDPRLVIHVTDKRCTACAMLGGNLSQHRQLPRRRKLRCTNFGSAH